MQNKRTMYRVFTSLLLVLTFILSFPGCAKQREPGETEKGTKAGTESGPVRLAGDGWAPDVKQAVNDFLDRYSSEEVHENYVVFDFDNTCSVFDIEEQLMVYQLQTMSFEVTPDRMEEILLTGLKDTGKDLTALGYGKGSFTDWAEDIADAYAKLWETYGPFSYKGVGKDVMEKLAADPYWQEFATKMRTMYELIGDEESADVSYPWVTYWFTGMTDEMVYDLSERSLKEYAGKETSKVRWASPEELKTRVGKTEYEWTSGASVTDSLVELWRALNANGIDIWVCSASYTGVIRAAIDFFGMHDDCTGMVAMTNCEDAERKIQNQYDFETGLGYCATKDGWERSTAPTKAMTQGKGKVTAIVNAISPEYDGRGPIAGFMDSTGDFNFCTEFDSLKLVICFNRADRRVTDGGGLIAEVAIYERDTLGYNLEKANAAGDTLYLLQGRDETGTRLLRNSNRTIKLSGEEKLFRGPENEKQLQAMIDGKMTVADVLNRFAWKEKAGENGFDFDTGFLTQYDGYHSIKDADAELKDAA